MQHLGELAVRVALIVGCGKVRLVILARFLEQEEAAYRTLDQQMGLMK